MRERRALPKLLCEGLVLIVSDALIMSVVYAGKRGDTVRRTATAAETTDRFSPMLH